MLLPWKATPLFLELQELSYCTIILFVNHLQAAKLGHPLLDMDHALPDKAPQNLFGTLTIPKHLWPKEQIELAHVISLVLDYIIFVAVCLLYVSLKN